MKKLMLLLAMVTSCACVYAQSDNGGTLYSSLHLKDADIQSIKASTEGGYINVTAAHTKDAHINVFIKCAKGEMSKDEIEQDLKENYKFKVGMDGKELKAELVRNSDDIPSSKRLYASFDISVPANVNTNLTTAGGDIILEGLNGKQEFTTSGGKLTILHVTGDINGATSGGNVLADNCKQNIKLSTSGGTMIANKCEGKIDLSTAGGKIILANLDGEIRAATSSGDIVAKNIKGSLNASDVAGNIVLAGLSCKVEATTTKGDLYADVSGLVYTARLNVNGGDLKIVLPKQLSATLDLNGDKITSAELQNFKGIRQTGKLSGDLNSGGAKLIATDTGGTMEIKTF